MPPVYLVVAYSIISRSRQSLSKQEILRKTREVLVAKNNELGDPQLPVEIVSELIREDLETSLTGFLLPW